MFAGHYSQADTEGPFPEPVCAPRPSDLDGVAGELRRHIREDPLVHAMMESIDGYMLILNARRQILHANHQFMEDMNLESEGLMTGRRPGDLLGCIHSAEGPNGCGTTKACASCGAAIALLHTLRDGASSVEECLATVRRDDALLAREFRVRTTPFHLAGHDLVIMVLTDISGDKRREALERTFFHDILNTLGGLLGWCNLLQEAGNSKTRRIIGRISQLSLRLKDEIEDHRRLSDAERGTLSLSLANIPVAHVLASVRMLFEAHEVTRGRTLQVTAATLNEEISTDFSLLLRVLANMVKNALEAAPEGAAVTLWFECAPDGAPVFRVHNPGVIPVAVAQRIFQRSFSTKPQRGHGIGTYSMKLFGERYLGGQVGFESTTAAGTTFFIRLPA